MRVLGGVPMTWRAAALTAEVARNGFGFRGLDGMNWQLPALATEARYLTACRQACAALEPFYSGVPADSVGMFVLIRGAAESRAQGRVCVTVWGTRQIVTDTRPQPTLQSRDGEGVKSLDRLGGQAHTNPVKH